MNDLHRSKPALLAGLALAVTLPLAARGESGEPVEVVPDVETFFEDYLEEDRNDALIALGARLYRDTRLSADGQTSCNTCHDLDRAGVAPSHVTAALGRETPTVYNSALGAMHLVDSTIPASADESPSDEKLRRETWRRIGSRLADAPDLVALARKAFELADGEPLPEAEGWASALEAYERSLLTPNAPFDRYLDGDADALGDAARRGYETFKAVGCTDCHRGASLGGASTSDLPRRAFFLRHAGGADVLSRELRAEQPRRRRQAIPTLRNVALTAPYFEDGSQATLADAIRAMAKEQLSVKLEDQDVADVAAFLESLTGERDGKRLRIRLPE